MITPKLNDGILKQFVKNLELNNPNTLRIVRMKSYLGAELHPFASEHIAWHDTASDPYCDLESFEDFSLRWTDVSTKNAVQLWRIIPAGFGMFFDVRSGQQLIIIATAQTMDKYDQKNAFTHWGNYLQNFDRLNLNFCSTNEIQLEAVRLEPGNRL